MSYFALVPAAGSGSRMGSAQPKQYLSLLGQPVIRHTLSTLCAIPELSAVFVVLSPDDEEWSRHDWSALGERLVVLRCGGETRAESVSNGLRAIADRVKTNDWVLVHDAARACLTAAHVRALIEGVGNDEVGGILAVPVADTLKRATRDQHIETTVSRDALWQAQTPQMFRHAQLLEALEKCPAVTDEASAMEFMGAHPRLVMGDATNLKITYPLDLQLAGWILQNRKQA
ncbi:MAG TPA: 2-C-methyl-D-erythritol 4-phosphate cytidylyltransferase [Rhodocyclaceae bacterium]|nr:2-C-methyl-D-erythritol 4-phosphate cytidylyltransferase [Rhodocyclaceae bacterium]